MLIDWGSVPDWLAGVGAVLALIFAGLAARSASKTNRMQAEQIRQLEEEQKATAAQQRASQAASVAFWVSSEFDNDEAALIRYVNSSVLPVYNVFVCCHTPVGTAEESYPVLGPLSDRRTLRRASRALRRCLEGTPFAELHDQGRVLVAVSFRDSAGVWWYRTAAGELHDAPDRAAAEAGARRPATP